MINHSQKYVLLLVVVVLVGLVVVGVVVMVRMAVLDDLQLASLFKIKYFLYSFNEKEKKNLSIILQSIIECHSSNTEIWFKPFLVIDFCAIHDFGTCFKTSFCPLCYVLRQMFNKYIILNVVFSWHMLILTLKYALWYFYSWIQNTL